jgi:NADH-quinone oxidoreductase subunit N
VLAAANAVLGVAVYLRWVRVLLQPAPDTVQEAMAEGGTGTVTAVTRVRTHPSHLVALGIGSAVLVLGSVQPDLLFGLLG